MSYFHEPTMKERPEKNWSQHAKIFPAPETSYCCISLGNPDCWAWVKILLSLTLPSSYLLVHSLSLRNSWRKLFLLHRSQTAYRPFDKSHFCFHGIDQSSFQNWHTE